MKKTRKKILSIILVILMLLNTIAPIAKAIFNYPDGFFVSEDDVTKTTGDYIIVELVSNKTSYKQGDEITVSAMLKTVHSSTATHVSEFKSNVFYESDELELKAWSFPEEGNGSKSSTFPLNSSIDPEDPNFENGPLAYVEFSPVSNGPVQGEKLFDMIFTAKKDSNPEKKAEIVLMNIDCTFETKDNNFFYLDNTVNTPNILLPQEGEIPPEPVIEKHGIEITKVDEEGNTIVPENPEDEEAIYKITPPGKDSLLGETKDGIVSFLDLEMYTENTDTIHNYTIEEMKAPTGYVLDNAKKILSVEFNEDGTIKNATINDQVQTVENNVIKIKLVNEKIKQEEVIPESKINFVINKKDEKGNLISTSNASFALELSEDDVRYLTTKNGTISRTVKVPEDVSVPYTYRLKETSAPEGYLLDNQEIAFDVSFNENADKTISVTNVSKTNGTNATITNTGNTITIDVVNEKIKETKKFQIEITKVDESGNAITSDTAKFILTSPTGVSQIAETSIADGKIVIEGNIPEGEMNPAGYTYRIQEIKAPNGYKLDQETKSVELVFTDTEDERKLTEAQITGTNITKGTIENNKLPINIINPKQQGNFTITINKVDTNGNPIRMANTSFKMTAPDGNTTLLQTDVNGVAIYKGQMPDVAGTQNYKIQEIVAPSGYVLNSNEVNLGLNFTKSASIISLTNATVSDPVSKVGAITNNNLVVNFKNAEEVLEEPAKDFDFIVTKIDSKNGQVIAREGTIFQLLKPDGTSAGLFETNSNGIATIKVSMPEEETTKVFKLVEKVAPAGYELDSTPMDVEVIFRQINGNIGVNDINVTASNIRKGNITSSSVGVSVENEAKEVPEPPKTFDLVINKKDSKTSANIEQENIVFKVTAPDGSINYVETDATGKAVISYQMPTTTNTYEYKIEEIKAPTGYTLYGIEQSVSVTFDSNLHISNSDISGAKIQKEFAGVNDEGDNEVIVSVLNDEDAPVEAEKFTIKVNKVDIYEANILQENVYFEVKDDQGKASLIKTNQEGIATFIGNIPEEAGTYEYKIQEVIAPKGYVLNPNELTLRLVFTENNEKIILSDIEVNAEEGVKKVGTISSNTAEIAIINEEEPESEKFVLRINKVDENDAKILQSDVYFSLEDNTGKVSLIQTNSKGIATILGDMPEEAVTYTYKLKEIVAPKGYIKREAEMKLDLIFTEEEGKIKLTDINLYEQEGVKKLGIISNNIVQISIMNEKEAEILPPLPPEKFTVKVNKVNQEEANILQANVYFKVEDENGNISLIQTDETGVATITGNIPEEAKRVTYKIQEIIAPSGYVKNANNMNIELVFTQEEGKVILSDVNVNEEQGIKKVGTVSDNTAEIAIINIQDEGEQPIEKFVLKVNKVDEEEANILQAKVYFKIEDENGNISLIQTDANGVAAFSGDVPSSAGTYKYKVLELQGPTGYIRNPNEMTIDLIFTKVEKKIVLQDITVNEEQGIKKVGAVTGNIAEVAVKNEKEPEEPIVTPKDKFILEIQKADKETKENINQKEIIFKVTDLEGKYSFIPTDATGEITLEYEMPETPGTYTYYIQETVAPDGYEKNPNRIPVQITFIENNGRIEIQSVSVEEENEVVFDEQARKENASAWSYAGKVVVLDEKIQEPVVNTFALELNKIDSETLESILQEGVIFKVKTQDGVSNYLGTDATGKIKINYIMPEAAGTIRFEIEEIKAPTGYKLLGDVQYLDITFEEVEGKIQIANASIEGNKIQMTYGTNQVTISILNDHEEIIVEPEKEEMNLKINKVDSKTLENILQAGVTFRVQDSNGAIAFIETDETGTGRITLNKPQEEGTYRYTLQEVLEPDGYEKNTKKLYLDITFTKVEEKLQIAEAIVNESAKIAITNIVEDEIELRVLNDKKEEPKEPEQPDEPTKPDVPSEPEKEFKVEVNKYLTKITENYSNTGLKKVTQVPRTNKINKLDIKASQFRYAILDLEYTIVVKNTGEISGTVGSVIDKMPASLKVNMKENAGWVKDENGNFLYNLNDMILQPQESKEIVLKATYDASKNEAGTIVNLAIADADVSTDGNGNGSGSQNGNKLNASSTLVVATKTGEEQILPIGLTLVVLTMLGLGILGIKKYVI